MMKFDSNGIAMCNVEDLIEIALAGHSWENCQAIENQDTKQFNHLVKAMDTDWQPLVFYQPVDQKEFDDQNQKCWFLPENYKDLNVKTHLENIAKDWPKEYYSRAMLEFELFEQANMVIILKQLIYIIGTFKENKIVWGPGRGSACASLVLYLLNVHFVDPIKYDLDINEFFKVL